MHSARHSRSILPISTSGQRLWAFVALSAAVHLLLALAWQVDPPKWSGPWPTLELQLVAAVPSIDPSVPSNTRRADQVQPAKSAPATTPDPAPAAERVVIPPPEPKTSPQVAMPERVEAQPSVAVLSPPAQRHTRATTAVATRLSRDELLRRIERRLALVKQYPIVARRRGWEGDVHLSFGVSERGAINTINVAMSSGFKLLDENAVAALRQIDQLLAEEESVDGAQRLDVAIRYRLVDG